MNYKPAARKILIALAILIGIGGWLAYDFWARCQGWSDGAPGVIAFSEWPDTLRRELMSLEQVGVNVPSIAAYRVYGEYDVEQTTICRIPYSPGNLTSLTEQLSLKRTDDRSWFGRKQKEFPSGWWPRDLRDSETYVNDGFLGTNEGPRYAAIYSPGEDYLFLWYDFDL